MTTCHNLCKEHLHKKEFWWSEKKIYTVDIYWWCCSPVFYSVNGWQAVDFAMVQTAFIDNDSFLQIVFYLTALTAVLALPHSNLDLSPQKVGFYPPTISLPKSAHSKSSVSARYQMLRASRVRFGDWWHFGYTAIMTGSWGSPVNPGTLWHLWWWVLYHRVFIDSTAS